jgi:hypothetical protein
MEFTYDKFDNIVKKIIKNRDDSETTFTYTYDNNGHLTGKVGPS